MVFMQKENNQSSPDDYCPLYGNLPNLNRFFDQYEEVEEVDMINRLEGSRPKAMQKVFWDKYVSSVERSDMSDKDIKVLDKMP